MESCALQMPINAVHYGNVINQAVIHVTLNFENTTSESKSISEDMNDLDSKIPFSVFLDTWALMEATDWWNAFQ